MDRMDEVRPMVMSFAFCGPSGSGKSSLLKAYLGAWKEHERSGFTQFCNKLFIAVSCTFLDSFLYLFVSFVIHIHCFSCLQKSLVLWSPSAHHCTMQWPTSNSACRVFSDHPRYTMRRADAIGLSFMRVHLKVDDVLVRVLLGAN